MKRSPKFSRLNNGFLLLAVVALAVFPLIFVQGEYGGADGEAQDLIQEVNPEYEPWFAALYEPPSGEIESLLFVTQAAIGAGVLGYGFGWYKGRQGRDRSDPS
jgi:cobalt/nickel transport protein